MTDEKTLQVVRKVVEEQLAPVRIIDVTVDEDFDQSGDRILRVAIVVERGDNKLDPVKVMGLARHLREPLERIEEDRFPVFTFLRPGETNGAVA